MNLLALLLAHIALVGALDFRNVSGKRGFGAGVSGYIAAFSDVTGDHSVDLILVNEKGIQVFTRSDDGHFQPLKNAFISVDKQFAVRSVLPGDFDGDSLQDVIVSTEAANKSLSIAIHWGIGRVPELSSSLIIPSANVDPVLVDLNGDLLPDILASTRSDGSAEAWCSTRHREFENCSGLLGDALTLSSHPQPSFLDIDNDLSADLMVTQHGKLQLWHNNSGVWKVSDSVLSIQASVIGQATWCDMDLDGYLDLILPVCHDLSCQQSSVQIVFHAANAAMSKPTNVSLADFGYGGKEYRFVAQGGVPFSSRPGRPPTLHRVDLNLDGYPDLVAIVRPSDSEDPLHTQVMILHNTPCQKHCSGGVTRTLTPEVMQGTEGAFAVAAVDLGEDGIPDLLVNRRSGSSMFVDLVQQQYTGESAFLKVAVTGHCNRSCSMKHAGGPFLGTIVSIRTTSEQVRDYRASAAILPWVGTMSLQLPYVVFGLGRAPNFVEGLTVSLPSYGTVKRTREWSAIIPNSQLLILTSLPDEPSSWSAHLIISPSSAVWQTFLVFTGTCVVMLLAIAFLHWREKREDEQEKREGARRFHFDAL